MVVPAGWVGEAGAALNLDRLLRLEDEQSDTERLGVADGLLDRALPPTVIPGITPARPISASGLQKLLSCPYWFFQERILSRTEPPQRPSLDVIDARSFGELLHTIAEAFFREHGPGFCRGEEELETWLARMHRTCERELSAFLDRYPLRGENATERERERVMRHAAQLVRHEWELGPREFGGAELIFGDPEPVALEVTGGTLYVEGAIDRVDLRQRGELDLRDLKTGRARDLAETPMEIGTDLQLGVYTLALDAAGIFPDARTVGATYVYTSTARDPERRFEAEPLAALRGYTEEWIAIARSVLVACAFVRTPDPGDCRYCPFKASCGDRAQARSRQKLRSAVPLPLSAFMALKCPKGAGE